VPADAVSEGASVDEYVTHVYVNSAIYWRDYIDLIPRAFDDILPLENASTPGLWTPRHDETEGF
jgi:hypothetical protein